MAILLSAAPRLFAEVTISRQSGESIVLVGTKPTKLAFVPAPGRSIELRSTYLPGLPNTTRYRRGRDYVLARDGTLRRTAKSRIPDYRRNGVYGLDPFDHFEHPDYGNNHFFAFVDYSYATYWESTPPPHGMGAEALAKVRAKLVAGKPVKIVAFGDSVTAGGESTANSLIFWQRWLTDLQIKYPQATVEGVNAGQGGDLTDDGLARLNASVIAHKPDLVLIAFGLNDFNKDSVEIKLTKWENRKAKWARSWAKWRGLPVAVPPRLERTEHFAKNLETIVQRVKKETDADVVLVSALQPNPKWKYTTGEMASFAAVTKEVARLNGCAYANVYETWQDISGRKKPEDLLANNANHPNDFGHWIYYQSLSALKL